MLNTQDSSIPRAQNFGSNKSSVPSNDLEAERATKVLYFQRNNIFDPHRPYRPSPFARDDLENAMLRQRRVVHSPPQCADRGYDASASLSLTSDRSGGAAVQRWLWSCPDSRMTLYVAQEISPIAWVCQLYALKALPGVES